MKEAYTYFEIYQLIVISFLIFWSVRSFIIVKRNQVNLVHYQIIGLVFFSNLFSLILRAIVFFWI